MSKLDADARRLAALLADTFGSFESPLILPTVTAVTAGGASDGNALVQVTRFGQQRKANGYLNSYTPTVNDRVLAVYVDDQLIVLGKVIGKP